MIQMMLQSHEAIRKMRVMIIQYRCSNIYADSLLNFKCDRLNKQNEDGGVRT